MAAAALRTALAKGNPAGGWLKTAPPLRGAVLPLLAKTRPRQTGSGFGNPEPVGRAGGSAQNGGKPVLGGQLFLGLLGVVARFVQNRTLTGHAYDACPLAALLKEDFGREMPRICRPGRSYAQNDSR
jgi:hypothetical protein